MALTAVFCVFARPAVPGEVKTRLAPAIGEEAAARLAAAFFRDTWASVAVRDGCAAVLATTGPPVGLGAPGCAETWLQGGGDLGARVERILRRGLAHAPWAVAIGADSPGMPSDRLDALLAARAHSDAAMIPAEDGGFIALAVARCPEGVLAGVPWSAANTAEVVLQRLSDVGMRVSTVAPWWDVDTPADLARLRAWLAVHPTTAPFTRRALADHVAADKPHAPR